MRRRLRNFLPIVLIALMVQIFAPIGACWAASIAASDPLSAVPICYDGSGSGGGKADQNSHHAHDGCCSTCCPAHVATSLDSPDGTVAAPSRQSTRVVWLDRMLDLSVSPRGSHAQARAPPFIS